MYWKTQAAEAAWQELQNARPELRVELVHGCMKVPEKQQLMLAFKAGKLQLLVMTTVI